MSRLAHDHAPSLGPDVVSPHVALAGAVEIASLALDLTASPVAAPMVSVGAQALTLGIATHAAMRAARRLGADEARARVVLDLAIQHAERRSLCSPYEAKAWRIVCRLPRARHEDDTNGLAQALVRDGSKALAFAALAKAVPKSVMKRAPWAPMVFRIARLPATAFVGARLVAAVQGHAEMLCRSTTPPQRVRVRARLGLSKGAMPARAARTVEPLLTIAAAPGVSRPSAPSPIAAALGAITRPRPRRTLAIA
jgi:hypothetical protein